MPHQLETLAVAQAHVGEAQVVALGLQALLRLGDRAHAFHPEAHLGEGELEQLADIGLVVDHQNVGRARRGGTPFDSFHVDFAWRQRMRKCAPGGLFAYSRVALFASQSSRARYRPRPVPLASVVKNGSNSCAWIEAGTPGPLSITESSTRSA